MEGELWGAQLTGSRTVRSEFIDCYTGRFAAALLDCICRSAAQIKNFYETKKEREKGHQTAERMPKSVPTQSSINGNVTIKGLSNTVSANAAPPHRCRHLWCLSRHRPMLRIREWKLCFHH